MISLQCPSCKKVRPVSKSVLGKEVRCNDCHHVFVVSNAGPGLKLLDETPMEAHPAGPPPSLGAAPLIRFQCICGSEIIMAQQFAGRKARCKSCGNTVTVPSSDAPYPAHMTLNVTGPKAINGFGLVAILLGVLACITCWIPILGLVSLPLSGLGLMFGVIGCIVSIAGRRSGMSLPIAGTVVCVIAIMIALWPIFFVGAVATSIAHEANRNSIAKSERPAPGQRLEASPTARYGPSPSLPPMNPAYGQAKRQRIETERIHGEESRAKLLPRFKAATIEHGLLLVRNNLQPWATSLDVTARDENLLTFSGKGLDESVIPFADVKFSGRISDEGKLVLDISSASGSLEFDTFLETGMFTMSGGWGKRGEYSLTPLDATLRKERAARRDEVGHILKQKLPEPTITLYDSADKEQYRRVQSIKYAFAAAEVNVRGQQAPKDGALHWVDGDLGTAWHPGGNFEKTQGTYSVRYKNPPKAKGIGLFIYPYDLFEHDSLKTATLTVNGQRRVSLPSYRSHSDSHAFIEIRFPEEMRVFELRFDVLNGGLPIGEIVIIDGESSVATATVQLGRSRHALSPHNRLGAVAASARAEEPTVVTSPEELAAVLAKLNGQRVIWVQLAWKDMQEESLKQLRDWVQDGGVLWLDTNLATKFGFPLSQATADRVRGIAVVSEAKHPIVKGLSVRSEVSYVLSSDRVIITGTWANLTRSIVPLLGWQNNKTTVAVILAVREYGRGLAVFRPRSIETDTFSYGKELESNLRTFSFEVARQPTPQSAPASAGNTDIGK